MATAALDLSREVTPFPGTPIGEDRAWVAADVSDGDWLIPLSDAALGEIRLMADQMARQPLPVILRSRDEFELNALSAVAAEAKTILDEGRGFVVLDRLPMDEYPEEVMLGCFWVIGQYFGLPVAQKWDGTVLYDVTDTGKAWQYGVRGSATNVELVFHVDNAFGVRPPDYVGLLCKHPALEGGLSRFCSLYTLHNRLLAECPELLQRLYEPMFYDRQAEHAPDAPKTSWAPFFALEEGRFAARANVSLVRNGYKVAGREMDERLVDALEAVERISRSEDLWYEAPIERGQMQYLNNRYLGHYRSEFHDNPDPALKRHLFRTWHRSSGSRAYDGG